MLGREAEMAAIATFLDSISLGTRALVLRGEPGAGKTTLWEAGLESALERGYTVLSARPSETEGRLSYAALGDLLESVRDEDFADLPAPQRHALDVALLRAEPTRHPPEPRAIAAGVLGVLRHVAERGSLLIAIDDIQWLDAASAFALSFVARRLDRQPVGFLLTERSKTSSPIHRDFGPRLVEHLTVGPLSLGATRALLAKRLRITLPRPVLRRVVDLTSGNPLFALEVGRSAAEQDLRGADELKLPDRLEDLLGVRVAALPVGVRMALLAVSLASDLRSSQLATMVDPADMDEAVRSGVLVVDGDRVRAAHPLLAAVARKQAGSAQVRDLHRALADAMLDESRWARHLALATLSPDADIASSVAVAASSAAARGAVDASVELAEHALRLTPPRSAERSDRLLTLAEYLMRTGQPKRVSELLEPELGSLPAGRARARAHLLLAEESRLSGSNVDAWGDHLDRAMAESAGDPALHALVTARRARYLAVVRVERLDEAEASVVAALPAARAAGPEVEREALYGLGWARYLRGRPIDDLREQFHAASADAYFIFRSLEPLAAERMYGRGDVSSARAMFERLLAQADERGETWSYVRLRLGLCELELRAGEWLRASALLDEWSQSPDADLLTAPALDRCRALLAVGRGDPEEALPWAARAIAESEEAGLRWDWLEAQRVHGTASLLAHDPAEAVAHLRPAWEYVGQHGIEDPSIFPLAPELVEALTELGDTQQARRVTDGLSAFAEDQQHPWALVTARRCRAMVDLASHLEDDQPRAQLAESAAAFDALGLRFDHARCTLTLGRWERRLRHWGSARRSLGAAAVAFEQMDSPGWADQARAELHRISGRESQPPDALTRSERRAAELAAQGLSNREIAAALFVGEHTVEVHLSRTYSKLGIRSRAALARRLAEER